VVVEAGTRSEGTPDGGRGAAAGLMALAGRVAVGRGRLCGELGGLLRGEGSHPVVYSPRPADPDLDIEYRFVASGSSLYDLRTDRRTQAIGKGRMTDTYNRMPALRITGNGLSEGQVMGASGVACGGSDGGSVPCVGGSVPCVGE